MKLHWSPRSPFVRKVMIVLHETDQVADVDCMRNVVAVSLPPNAAVMADNPLNKIPTFITDEGQTLFDSRVICEYLDTRAGTGLIPAELDARFWHLKVQALADGMMDNLLLWRTEMTRTSGPWEAITSGWQIKARATLSLLEQEAEALANQPFGMAQVTTICLLGHLDFRWPDCGWRDQFPKLAKLDALWAQRPSVIAAPVPTDDDPKSNAVTKGQLRF